MGLAELKADAKLAREALMKRSSDNIDYKLELCENIIPLLEGIIDGIVEECIEPIVDLEEGLDELVDQSSDVLHPETAARIVGVLEYGKLLAHELKPFLAQMDDVKRKKIKRLLKDFEQGVEIVMAEVVEMTVVDEDESEGEDSATPEQGPSEPRHPVAEEPDDAAELEGDR